MKNARTLLTAAIILMIVVAFQSSELLAQPVSKTRPNIIFVMADDLGIGDLGIYGQKKIRTPQIDRMAGEGVRFTQVYAGSSVCAPSRCSLMTGMHNGHNRLRDNIPHGVFLQPDDKTVAEMLKQGGYTTGAIGKWSLGNPGSWGVATYQGFDYFYGHLNQDQAHFYYPDYLWENDKIDLLSGNRGERKKEYTHNLFTKKALSFIDDNYQNPFFLYVAYTLPHYSDYDKNSPDSQIVPSDAPYTNENWPQVEKNYAAMVSMIDADVGKILEKVKQLGLDSNTIVFFTSDNGPCDSRLHDTEFFASSGIHKGVKRDMYEGGLRIPMIVRWPGNISPGSVSDAVWAFWDFLPTAADIAGIPFENNTDGISVLPSILGEKQKLHDYLYWDYGHVRDMFIQAARWEDWKGIKNATGSYELFDLAEDPGEKNNLASERPDLVQHFEEIIKQAYVASKDYPTGDK